MIYHLLCIIFIGLSKTRMKMTCSERDNEFKIATIRAKKKCRVCQINELQNAQVIIYLSLSAILDI